MGKEKYNARIALFLVDVSPHFGAFGIIRPLGLIFELGFCSTRNHKRKKKGRVVASRFIYIGNYRAKRQTQHTTKLFQAFKHFKTRSSEPGYTVPFEKIKRR